MEQQSKASEQWSGAGGKGWVAAQRLLDETYQSIEDLLVGGIEPGARHVLDVGCGSGGTTVAAARGRRATGIDISEPLVAAARRRAAGESAQADFIVADAEKHPFEPATFDAVISRFGVMFFSDAVAAFANLRRAATAGAELRMIAWRSMQENPFMTAAERAAAPLLPDLPTRQPSEPGQFGFADADYVRAVLEKGGWSEIDLRPIDIPCAFPASELDFYLNQLGPVGRVLQSGGDELRARVIAAVRPAFAPYIDGEAVRFNAACWLIVARS